MKHLFIILAFIFSTQGIQGVTPFKGFPGLGVPAPTNVHLPTPPVKKPTVTKPKVPSGTIPVSPALKPSPQNSFPSPKTQENLKKLNILLPAKAKPKPPLSPTEVLAHSKFMDLPPIQKVELEGEFGPMLGEGADAQAFPLPDGMVAIISKPDLAPNLLDDVRHMNSITVKTRDGRPIAPPIYGRVMCGDSLCGYVTENLGQDMFIMSKAGLINKAQYAAIFDEIEEQLRILHANGYDHGDLHPGNIVLRKRPDDSFEPHLIDFQKTTGLTQQEAIARDLSFLKKMENTIAENDEVEKGITKSDWIKGFGGN